MVLLPISACSSFQNNLSCSKIGLGWNFDSYCKTRIKKRQEGGAKRFISLVPCNSHNKLLLELSAQKCSTELKVKSAPQAGFQIKGRKLINLKEDLISLYSCRLKTQVYQRFC